MQNDSESDTGWTSELRDVIWDKLPAPPVGLAFVGSLGDKFHASMMESFLIGGGLGADSHALALSAFAAKVVVATGDLGVEFRLPRVRPMRVQQLSPRLPIPSAAAPRTEEDDWAFNPEVQLPVSFYRALQVPGLQHVVHKAAADMVNSASALKAQGAKLAAVAKKIRGKHSRKRLVNLCYAGPVGQLMAAELKFRGVVQEKRWRTATLCADDVLKCQQALTWGWKYIF